MVFQPGKSGNPGGRPKGEREALALAREHSETAILRLVELMKSDSDRASIAACNAILDRAWGKPPQAVTMDATVTDGDAVGLRNLPKAKRDLALKALRDVLGK